MTKDPPEIFVAKIPLNKKLNAKFEKEARILRHLAGHEGVPKVFGIIEVMNKKALVQEFIFGKTLYEVIERDLEEKEVESVVIQLTDVVAHAHDLGVVHRDIKPGNIMVRPNGTIKLLDFGAAKELRGKRDVRHCNRLQTLHGTRANYGKKPEALGRLGHWGCYVRALYGDVPFLS